MSLKDRIHLIPREFKSDARGWLLKVIDGHEADLPPATGEIYLVHSQPGQVRGNHYHTDTSEWFTIVQGSADVLLKDIETGERLTLALSDKQPVTLYVPQGVAHAFVVAPDAVAPMLLIAYADKLYNPSTTIAYKLD